jgi:hypothetical protein
MRKSSLLGWLVAVIVSLPALAWSQAVEYPQILIPTAEGPFSFPSGYQTPWDEVEIMVTEKIFMYCMDRKASIAIIPMRPAVAPWRCLDPMACCW